MNFVSVVRFLLGVFAVVGVVSVVLFFLYLDKFLDDDRGDNDDYFPW